MQMQMQMRVETHGVLAHEPADMEMTPVRQV